MRYRNLAIGTLVFGAIVAGAEHYAEPKKGPEFSDAPVVLPVRTQVKQKTRKVLEDETDPLPCSEELDDYLEFLEEDDTGEEEKDLRAELRDCSRILTPNQRGLLSSLEVEKKAELRYKLNCLDREDQCESMENGFVETLEDFGVEGWIWNPDFEFIYDQNGWTTGVLSYPGFQLQLPATLADHEDSIHLEPMWNGEEPVVTFTLVHEDEESAAVMNFNDDFNPMDVRKENLETIRDLWFQANEQ